MRTNLVAKLRQAMEQRIRADALPPEGKIGPRQVRMVAARPREVALDLAQVEKLATNVFWTNIFTLSLAREELPKDFPAEEEATARFLADFLKVNCAVDVELTSQSRRKSTDSIWTADDYEAGQVVVRRGDLIDTRLKAVLDQLRDRAAGDQARRDLAKGQLETQSMVAQLHQQAMRAQTSAQLTAEQNRWLLGGIIGASLAFLFARWRLTHWKRSHSLLPARVRNNEVAGTVISCPSCAGAIVLPLECAGPAVMPTPAPQPALPMSVSAALPAPASEEHWRQRALDAERRLEKSQGVLRAALLPHLARWLTSKLGRVLLRERGELIETQKKAEQDLAELEQRLASVQAPLEDRLQAYEQRIAELENDLSAKGVENQELIKATIAMARKRLEMQKSKDPVPWN